MNVILRVSGGIGRNIIATAVCKAVKAAYPDAKLLVLTAYPVVYLCNPFVDKVLDENDLNYFYTNYIEGKDVKLFLHEPLLDSAFINGTAHLIEVWCGMIGIPYNGEQPEIFLTSTEKATFAQQFASPKPILLLQTHGGSAPRPQPYTWVTDIPLDTAQQLVNHCAADYNIAHLRRKDQPALKGVTPLEISFRAICVLLWLSEKRLFINSFAQHAAAALGKPSVVCWVGHDPAQYSYALHTNIVAAPPANRPELRHSVFTRYNTTGQVTESPYQGEANIFNVDQILAALRSDDSAAKAADVRNTIIADKIGTENRKKSMVAARLACMSGKVDLSNVNTILDIGSWHLGQSMEFASIFSNAGIHAFEPVPRSFNLCLERREQLDDQKKERIKVHNVALSNADGEIPFYPVDPDQSSVPNVGASSMFRFIDGLNGTPFGQNLVQREIKVQAKTLDNWCTENKVDNIDIIWMDVQGAELHVLQGAEKMLSKTNIIMTEVGLKPYYEGHTLKADIDAFLFARGFRELEGAFELNGFAYEANTIYVRSK